MIDGPRHNPVVSLWSERHKTVGKPPRHRAALRRRRPAPSRHVDRGHVRSTCRWRPSPGAEPRGAGQAQRL